jgi:hypothetical protein
MRWRPVPGFDRYEVSDRGRVRRIGGRVLRPHFVRGGYAAVGLRRGGETHKKLVDRLVADAFGGLPPGMQIDHKRSAVATRREIIRAIAPQPHSSSFKGVSYIQARRRWYASIRINGRTRGLGFFNDEVAAARAYDKAALAECPASYINFPRNQAGATSTSRPSSSTRGEDEHFDSNSATSHKIPGENRASASQRCETRS